MIVILKKRNRYHALYNGLQVGEGAYCPRDIAGRVLRRPPRAPSRILLNKHSVSHF